MRLKCKVQVVDYQIKSCRDAQPVHLQFYSHGADARTVRPYIPIQAGLMCEMEERASYSNACRDARLVRPLKKPCIYAYILNGTDARTVRPYIPIQAELMCEMEGRTSYSNACRDARLVHPLEKQVRRGSKNKRIASFHRKY